jgi:hypothetical protein
MQTLYICGQHLAIHPGLWGTLETCPSHIAQSTLTAHQYTPSHQQQGLASRRSAVWFKLGLTAAGHPSTPKPGQCRHGFGDWAADSPKKHLLGHKKIHLTDVVTWTTSFSYWVTLEWERDQFGGFCFGQLGRILPICASMTSCSHT